MRKSMILVLSGQPSVVAAALAKLKSGSSVVNVDVESDGSNAQVSVLQVKASSQAIEIDVNAENPGMSQFIRLPATEAIYLANQDQAITPEAAAANALIRAAAYDDQGFVEGTDQREILTPTGVGVYDQMALYATDGKKIADVQLPTIDGPEARITATLAYADDQGSSPLMTFANQGDTAIYGLDPAAIQQQATATGNVVIPEQALLTTESPIARAIRPDKNGISGYQLENGDTIKVRATPDRQLEIVETKKAMEQDADTSAAQPWESFGLTHAVSDEDGAPTIGSVRPTASGATYRFETQAIAAPEVSRA
jgi:hypothetical protein